MNDFQAKSTPIVSIIMPSYNSINFIDEAISSVLAQTYQNWEMIIVDDASTDGSNNIIKKYAAKNSRIKLITLDKNSGPAISRNKALNEAKGKYIAFLDSDDAWMPNKLKKQITAMEKENILMSYSSYTIIDKNSTQIGLFNVKETVSLEDMLKTSTIGTLTTIYNAEKLGKFYFKNHGHEDYIMKLQILKKIKYAKGILEPLAKYRILKNSLSHNKIQASKWQWFIYRKIEDLPFFTSLAYFLSYTYHGLKKHIKP